MKIYFLAFYFINTTAVAVWLTYEVFNTGNDSVSETCGNFNT